MKMDYLVECFRQAVTNQKSRGGQVCEIFSCGPWRRGYLWLSMVTHGGTLLRGSGQLWAGLVHGTRIQRETALPHRHVTVTKPSPAISRQVCLVMQSTAEFSPLALQKFALPIEVQGLLSRRIAAPTTRTYLTPTTHGPCTAARHQEHASSSGNGYLRDGLMRVEHQPGLSVQLQANRDSAISIDLKQL